MNVILGKIQKGARAAIRQGRSVLRHNLEQQAMALAKDVHVHQLKMDERRGFVHFNATDIGIEPAVTKISSLCHSWKDDPSRGDSEKAKAKGFLINLLKPEDLFSVPEVLDVVFDDHIFGAVTEYLGQIPQLVTVQAWHSIPNNTAIRSQLYHYDHRDTRQAKVFINLNDIDDRTGPLHFLPANKSELIETKLGYSQADYTDEQVYSCCSPDEVLKTVGPKGDAFLVDTARCLHYGSRGNERERFMLMFCFARVNCVKDGKCEVLDPVRDRLANEFYADNPVRAFALKKR